MTSLCNETAWTRSPPFYTPKPFLSIFVRVSTLSTIGFLAEARWNLAAMASFRLTGRRGAVGTGARFAHSRKNYLKKKSLNCMHKALALTIAKISYSQLSDKSTGTMEKNLPKSLVVLTFLAVL